MTIENEAKVDDLIYNPDNQPIKFDEEQTGEEQQNTEAENNVSDNDSVENNETNQEHEIEIPEKFKNKSLEDVIKSYVELEKEFGRKNQEVGELRKLTDQILQQSLAENQSVNSSALSQNDELDDFDLLDNPIEAVEKLVERNPKLQQIEQELRLTKAELAQKRLNELHPDYQQIIQDASFQRWVFESPVRKQLFLQADREYDFEAANELLNWYKSSKKIATETRKTEAEKVSKKVTTESKGTGGTENNKPVFSRKELIRLRVEDPARYRELEPMIMEAYAEGRVR